MVLSVSLVTGAAAVGITATAFVATVSRLCRRRNEISAGDATKSDLGIVAFRGTYLSVYLMATMADWLQGPYVFAHYESLGFPRQVCEGFFVVGFTSSMFFGTFSGMQADRHGRRRCAVLYCVLYIVCCISKHINSYAVLFVGHSAAGAAISLLYCVFDSWLVSEHARRGFDQHSLGVTFSMAAFGNSVVAVVAGEIGEVASALHERTELFRDIYMGGYCTPFDVAIVVLLFCLAMMLLTWSENYSEAPAEGEMGLLAILQMLFAQPALMACGIVCAAFEASMFVFVVLWTPALQEPGTLEAPFGHIFSVFMLMCMLGSVAFSVTSQFASAELIGLLTLGIAAGSHLFVAFTTDITLRFLAFLLFEISVGLYWPMMGSLKSNIVPENLRSTVYSLYRVPLNIAVLAILLLTTRVRTAFFITTVLLVIAICAQARLVRLSTTGHQCTAYEPVSHLDPDASEVIDDSDGAPAALKIGNTSVSPRRKFSSQC